MHRDDQLIARYHYNRFGERIKKVVHRANGAPKNTYYLYDGHQLTAEADEAGQITAQYLYLHNQPVAKLERRKLYAIHADHLGTPRSATDQQGRTVWAAQYSPFGEATVTTEAITLNVRLPGQYFDAETGTHYNYFRTYDPGLGRYQSSDPIRLAGGLNTYAYVGGNPISRIDPLGLFDPTTVRPGTPLYRALIQAGLISQADGPAPFIADIAAIAYLSAYAAMHGQSMIMSLYLVSQPSMDEYNTLLQEVQLYKPHYAEVYPADWQLTWDNFYNLLYTLYDVQVEYVNANGDACQPGYNQELYNRAQAAILFREQMLPNLQQHETQIEPQIQTAYDQYVERGGRLLFSVWVAEGMPVSDNRELAPDANRQLSEAEAASLNRLRTLFPNRDFRVSDHEGAEYVDDQGRTYDQMGDPQNSQYWNKESFVNSIERHLLKSNDFTVVDLTGYTSEQKEEVREYVESLPQSKQDKIIRIGF